MDENEKLDESFEIQESDETNWKEETLKLREKAIRQREKTKDLRNSLKEAQTKLADMERAKPPVKSELVKSDEFGLLEKTYLRSAGITAEDEVELARDVQKKTGLDWDKLVDDDYFASRLEHLRTAKRNTAATADVKGEGAHSSAKDTPEYWIGRGELPEGTPQNRKLLAAIARKMVEDKKTGKKFYNE